MKVSMLKQNIALIGMMGCGKTGTAKELQTLMPKYKLIETDAEIENRAQLSIKEIFTQKGEAFFRSMETNLLKDLKGEKNLIISTGGGMYLKEENRNLLKENTFTVYLSAGEDTLFERLKNDTSRPLLNVKNLKQRISELLKERVNIYKLADLELKTDNKTPLQTAQEILEHYIKNGN